MKSTAKKQNMSKYSENFNTLDKLERKIAHLKARSKTLEQQLEENLDYLQDNYGSMVKSSIFKKTSSAGENFSGFLIRSFVNQHQFQEALDRVIEHFAAKAAYWIDSLMNWVSKNEKN